jgi:phosphoserine phosphatase RsbU/P
LTTPPAFRPIIPVSMEQQFLPLENDKPGKPVMAAWKWIGLLLFALALVFRPWLHGLIVFVGYVSGTIVLAGLAARLFRFLKRRFFWRVRNRVLGSFIFVGFLPLLLLAGTAFLASYALVGQLAANYLESSLASVVAELSSINSELAGQVEPDKGRFNAAADVVFRTREQNFPKIFARLSRKLPDGRFEILWTDERRVVAPAEPAYPAGLWLGSQSAFDGLLRHGQSVIMTSLHAVPRFPGYYLEVSAPLEQSTEQRLEREKSLYAIFEGAGRSKVREGRSGIKIEVNDSGVASESHLDSRTEYLAARRKSDNRRMIWWWTLLDSKNHDTGNRDFAAVSIFYVPLQVLYQTYMAGKYNQGDVLLRVIYVLAGLFVVVELISVFIGVTISKRITGSIHDLYQGMIALQKGDLQHRIPVRRKDQLGLLAHSFNQMTASMTHLLEEVSEKKRLEQELEIAREVQATLFPKQLPHAPGLTVFGGCEPARVVSGDYYDFIVEDESRLHIVVGDISGKGISAALMMANLQAAMRNQLLLFKQGDPGNIGETLAEMMRRLNQQIYLNSPSEKYVTLFASLYDAPRRTLHFCNAGHLPPILIDNGDVQRLEAGGTVLGLFEAARFQPGSVQLDPGAILAIFTDGVTEAFNSADEEFGEEHLLSILRDMRRLEPEAIYRGVTDEVRRWQGSLKQHDDITLIIAKGS